MPGDAPAVTVLIGIYNNASTLDRAVDSILSQTIADLEVLLIDDGSGDGSVEVARRAAARDARVRVLPLPRNVGIAHSLNEGLRTARAAFVAIQDADDYSAPERLETQVAVLAARPEVAVVGSRMHEVDAAGAPLQPRTRFASGDVNSVLMAYNPIPNSSACLRRDAVLALGGYDARYRYAPEYDLWLRLAERWAIVALDTALATRVMSGHNVAARADRAQTAETIGLRIRALRRRRTMRGASRLVVPIMAWLTPTPLKRARRRRLGQAP